MRQEHTAAGHAHADHSHHGHHHDAPASRDAHRVKDPVCGMDVDPHATPHKAEHQGHPYYFCSVGCRSKFLAEPARYVASATVKAEAAPEGTIYTCPMHPEIRQVGPGS